MTRSYNISGLLSPSKRVCSHCGEVYSGKGKSKYCSKLCSDHYQYEASMLKVDWRINRLLYMARNRSKSKNLNFDLDLEFLLDLWNNNNGCCEISKIPFELGRSEKGKVHPYAPSLDRIIPEKGYVKGNVRIIVYQLNVALSEFGLEQFNNFINLYITNSDVTYR